MKSDLRLNQAEKRKLAPLQAYCSYAWDKGLREIVIEEWEKSKSSHMSTDDDDPATDSIATPSSGSHIPINFKLKIAKIQYNKLDTAQKKLVDAQRDAEQKKMYRLVPEIKDAEERAKKLQIHKK